MLLPRAVPLLIAVFGARVAAGGEASHVTETLAKLEALVGSMADGQAAAESRPAPVPIADDVVILEEEHRRLSLPSCACNHYEQGAKFSTATCFKRMAGKNYCRSGQSCPSDYTTCTVTAPAPSPLAAAEDEEETTSTYVNAYLRVSSPSVTEYSQLPSASAFGVYLAQMTQVKVTQVKVSTSMSAAPSAMVHATIHVKDTQQKDEVSGALRGYSAITVEGKSFTVSFMSIEPSEAYPLVCTPEEETAAGIKMPKRALKEETVESAALLKEMVELKRQELELLRSALQGGSSTCSPSDIAGLSKRLGLEP